MGFRPQPVEYNLDFEEGDELHGLEVKIRSVTVREYNEMMRNGLKKGEDGLKASDDLLELFVERLVAWNLEDPETGDPVPPTMDGLLSQDRRYIGRMVQAWQIALVGIPAALGKALNSGERSLEESLAMAISSENHQS